MCAPSTVLLCGLSKYINSCQLTKVCVEVVVGVGARRGEDGGNEVLALEATVAEEGRRRVRLHEEADKVFPSHDDQLQIPLVPIVIFPSKDVFDPDSPVVFKHNASVSVVRLGIVRVAFLLVPTPIITWPLV